MLNTMTVERRAGLRRYRALMLLVCVAGFALGALLVVGGLWWHVVPVAMAGLGGVPVGLRARVCYLGVRRSLRLLGA